jgi:hypothetical protein
MARRQKQESSFRITEKITGHFFVYVLSIAMTAWSGQSPRVLLYTHGFSVLYRLMAVWLFAVQVSEKGHKGGLVERFTREPQEGERSRPWQDHRTGKPAGMVNYLVVIFTLLFTVGIVLRLGSGSEFLSRQVLLPEIGLSLFIAFLYLVDDLISKQLVVSMQKPVPINLGYNVGGLNFLAAAVFISAFLLVISMNIASWLFDSNRYVIAAEWLVLLVLSTIRLVHDILGETKKSGRLP